jgi:hypothetical protein
MQALSMFGGTDDIIEQMTGEAPLTVQTFIARHKDAFPWPDEVWRWVHNDGRPEQGESTGAREAAPGHSVSRGVDHGGI